MPEVPWGTIGDLSGWSIVAVIVFLMFTGRLRSQKNIDEMRQDLQSNIEIWRDAYKISELARKEQEVILRENLELGKTAIALLRSLREYGDKV